jgi:hypothetical protein
LVSTTQAVARALAAGKPPGAQEADAGNNPGRHAQVTAGLVAADRAVDDEARGAEGNQRVGPQPGHLLSPLPLDPDRSTHQQPEPEAHGDVGDIQHPAVSCYWLAQTMRCIQATSIRSNV